MPEDSPVTRIRLHFKDEDSVKHVSDPIHRDLSAIAGDGDVIFVACDETAGVDRLAREGDHFGAHEHVDLSRYFDLPDGAGGEMDIEGLDIDDGWLWVAGSQSLTRGKAAEGDSLDEAFEQAAEIGWDPNRQFLGCVPLADGGDGLRPVDRIGKRKARMVAPAKMGRLRKWLKGDAHIGPFLMTPSKENGLDIEGMAARGARVFLGLRGPVLREHAIVLELRFKVTKKGYLKAKRIDGKRRYLKHLIDTKGQGIRDMKFDGDDLLILTGTVMAGDGPSELLRLPGFAGGDGASIWPRDRQDRVRPMPYRGPHDHPEGLMRWDGDDWLVVYDSPAPDRVSDDPPWVEGDVWRL